MEVDDIVVGEVRAKLDNDSSDDGDYPATEVGYWNRPRPKETLYLLLSVEMESIPLPPMSPI